MNGRQRRDGKRWVALSELLLAESFRNEHRKGTCRFRERSRDLELLGVYKCHREHCWLG